MDLSEHPYLISILLGIIEGLTEFLPVSSTAHLRIVKPWLFGDPDILSDPYWKMYDVVIQLGAICAVVWYFRRRIGKFLSTFPRGESGDRSILTHPLSLVMLASAVTAGPALLLVPRIKQNLESLLVMGLALVIGGVVMWVVDAIFGEKHPPPMPEELGPQEQGAIRAQPELARRPPARRGLVRTFRMEDLSPLQAVWIGAAQILAAVFPGTSRSMSTIAAGQLAGLSRPAALEFSFFLAIPIMFVACSYDLVRTLTASPGAVHDVGGGLTGEQWGVLATGFLVSFFVAWGVIAWFMAWVRRHGFMPFAGYRITLGMAVLAWHFGWLSPGQAAG